MNDPVAWATLVTAIAAAFVTVWNAVKIKQVQQEVNGRLSQLIVVARNEAYARGKADASKEMIELAASRKRATDPPAA